MLHSMLLAAAGFVLLWFGTLTAYLAVMNLARMKREGTLTRFWKINGLPIGVVGWLLDFTWNQTLGVLLFGELAHELLFSHRVQRWVDVGPGRRWERALGWARELNAVSPGHITLPPDR